MKRLLISLVLISLLATTTVMVAIAQEPTVEPTEEPTAEPTEEPTAEPTEEPTVEPTEEPTAEPTEEPTAEPTEEPTVEPTEEPTAEPTEEPTAEPTEEPTAEPTEEPTAEPTEEPTAEPTEEPTAEPTMGAQGDVGAQAMPGSWNSEFIGVQNLGSSMASVQFELYPQGSGSAADTKSFTLPVSGSTLLDTSDFVIANGAYAGVISADEPVAAAVLNTNYTGGFGETYLGFNSVSNKLTLPVIYRNYYYFQSYFYIQNASDSDATVDIYAYKMGSSTPSPTTPVQRDVPAKSSVTVDFLDSQFDDFGDGPGYAVVDGGSTDIAVVCHNYRYRADLNYMSLYYQGYPDTAASMDLVAPSVYNQYYKWEGGVAIVNQNVTTATVNMTYTVSTEVPVIGGNEYTATLEVGPYASEAFVMKSIAAIPSDSYGSVVLESDLPVLGIVNSTRIPGGGIGFSSPAADPAAAKTKFAAPIAVHGHGGWDTGIAVVSVGGGGTITTRWVAEDTDPPTAYVFTATGTAGDYSSFQSKLLEAEGLPANFKGSVYVEASGTGQKLLVLANVTRFYSRFSSQYPAYGYE